MDLYENVIFITSGSHDRPKQEYQHNALREIIQGKERDINK